MGWLGTSKAEKGALSSGIAIQESGVISTQILGEFFVNVTSSRKFSRPMSATEAHEYIEDYLQCWEVVSVIPVIALEAVRGVRDHQFSFWDAQIRVTAKLNQTAVIYSEDFNVGATIEGVLFVNSLANEQRDTNGNIQLET